MKKTKENISPKDYTFKFSIVSAVYNVEKYLEEMILSIVNQDIGFKENVQLILVDDCSKDNSFEICKKYEALYPNNIKAIQLEKNSGNASTPRNVGMQYVEGKYINCTDSDDLLTTNTLSSIWKFFEKHEDSIDVVAIPLYMFYNNDKTKLTDTRRNVFYTSDRIVDLKKEWKNSLFNVTTAFYHNRVKDFFVFDASLINGEDMIVANKVLLEKQKFGLICNCKYLYRQHSKEDLQESLIQRGQKTPSWYTHSIKNITQNLYSYAKKKYGFVPLFLQYTLATDLQWRLIVWRKAKNLFSPSELKVFYTTLLKTFIKFDYKIIKTLPVLPITEKIFVLKNKYIIQKKKTAEKVANDLYKTFPPTVHLYDFKHYSDGSVEIFIDFNDVLHESKYKLTANIDGNVKKLSPVSVIDSFVFDTQILYRKKFFVLKLNKDEFKHYSRLKFVFVNRKQKINATLSGIKNFPLNGDYYGNYYIFNNFVMSLVNNTIRFDKKKFYSHITCEARYLKSIFKKTTDNKFKIFVIRMIYKFLKPFFKNKTIWLISDKADRADDNGEAFFKYMQKHKRKNDKVYFVINKSSQDYARLQKIGKCINHVSYKHQILHLFATHIVSAHTHLETRYPLGIYTKYIQDTNEFKNFIFLQHGIINADLSLTLNKGNVYSQLFATSAKREYDSIVGGNYGFLKHEVMLSGLTRYDELYNDPKRVITFAPTWRRNLFGPMDRKTNQYSLNRGFENSEYYKFIISVLTNKKLLDACKKYNYKFQFLPHSTLVYYKSLFEVNPEVKVLGYETNYKKLFAENSLIITDTSSLVFDFAYLKKPIIYTLFDSKNGETNYAPGYFDRERDGLGDVLHTLDETIDCIIDYMKNDCKLKPKYEKRINDFYAFNDKNNCKRVFNAILKLENKNKK